MGQAKWVQIQLGPECAPTAILQQFCSKFCLALSQSVDLHKTFFYHSIAALSYKILYDFLSLEFHEWQSSADRLLIFNMNFQLSLFWLWSTWRRAQGQD